MKKNYNLNANTEDFEFAALEQAIYYPRAIVSEFRNYIHGNIVEVGAGIGQMSKLFAKESCVENFVAIEPDPTFAKLFQEKNPELKIINGTIESLDISFCCDAIVSVNVLEHIEDDQVELKAYHDVLKKKHGHLCILTPAFPEIYAPIDKDFGHFRRYKKEDLEKKLKNSGFKIIKTHYFNSVGFLVWWMNFKILSSKSFNPFMVKLYDRMIFRNLYKIERKFKPFLGQSIIAIAQALDD